MPQFELSSHAIEQCQLRGIPQKNVFEILAEPDKIDVESEGQLVYQKNVLFDNGKIYLVRVFVNSDKTPNLVKTVYRTSKFSKYE